MPLGRYRFNGKEGGSFVLPKHSLKMLASCFAMVPPPHTAFLQSQRSSVGFLVFDYLVCGPLSWMRNMKIYLYSLNVSDTVVMCGQVTTKDYLILCLLFFSLLPQHEQALSDFLTQ